MLRLLKKGWGYICNLYTVAFALSACLLCEIASAQGVSSTEISVTTPNFNWTQVATQVISSLTSVVGIGLGIGISLWVLFMVVRVFRRSAS
jgi:hypothetical protein